MCSSKKENFIKPSYMNPKIPSKKSRSFIESLTLILLEGNNSFNEFEPRLKSPPKKRFQLSAGLSLEKFNRILSVTNHILTAAKIL